MIFILLVFAGLAYLYYGHGKQMPHSRSVNSPKRNLVQPISWQAAQGFEQGEPGNSIWARKTGEGNRAVAQPQQGVIKGAGGSAGTLRIMQDLLDRLAKTFDPQWRMRYANAYHRMSLQDDVDNERAPRADLNIDRFTEEINNDCGPASGFTRTQFTYQQRYTKSKAAPGRGPNAVRPLDQEDPGDQTAMQTTLNPNGFKSVIYPYGTHDCNGVKKLWPGLLVRNLEKEFWAKPGRAYNAGYVTQEAMPPHKGWNWSFLIPKRGKHGAYPSNRNLPGRSNRYNNQTSTGGGTG